MFSEPIDAMTDEGSRSFFKMIVSYDGTDFCGWEKQAQGERTLQGVIEESLQRLTEIKVSIHGAGRTDSGVHALGQIVSFSLEKNIKEETLFKGLNALLPKDIRVLKVRRTLEDFHARYSARFKTYFYQMMEASYDDPFRSRFYHRVRKLPDVEEIRVAASELVGTKDFSALQAAGSEVRSSQRTVKSIKVRWGKDWVRVFFTANGFLYRMVRNMISFIMAQAAGTLSMNEAKEILASGNRSLAPPTFPAKGLFLWRVWY